MSNLALLLLISALAFASLTWAVYGLQRRRELERSARAREALLGTASPALPRSAEPARLPDGLASSVDLAAPRRTSTPATVAAAASAEAFGAKVPTSDDGLETGAFENKTRLDSDPLEGQRRLRAGEPHERGKAAASAAGGNSASAVIAAADAASAAASAAGAAPEASIVSIEPGQPSDTTVVAAKPDTDADRAPTVVLVHGILGFDHLKVLRWRFHYFRGVADHLRRVGVNAYVVRVPALDAIPARALALAEFVKALPHRHVTLVAHSMGGLDARYAITHLGLAERVPVLVTVATPHRGTPLADLLARRTASMARRLAAKFGMRSEAIECLTTERMARFNEEVPDAPGVTYACVPCGRRARPGAIHPLLRPTHAYLRRIAGPNDGLVPVSSQLWGAVVEEIEADHWAQVGWSHRFDAPLFYADVVVHLSKLGLLAAPSFAELPPARTPLRLGPATAATVVPAAGLEPRP